MSGLRIPASFPKMTAEDFFVLYHEALFRMAWNIIKTNCFASQLHQDTQEEFAQDMVVEVYKGFYSYDPSRGVPFPTWAWIVLERRLRALLRPHLIVFFICNCGKVERDDDNGETCDYCNSKVHKSFRRRPSHSLDEKIGDGGQTFADNLPDYRIHNFEDAHERARDSWLLPGFSECQLELEFQERQILWLHYVEHYTYEEIGEMLEINPKTVKTKAHRARVKFKDCIFTKLWKLLHPHLIVCFICNCGKVERDDDNGETCDNCKSKVHKSFRLRPSHSLDEKIGWLLPGFSECQLELEFQERQILLLRDVERYTYVKIGKMLGINPETVETKAHIAKEKFIGCIFTKLRAKGLPNDLDFLDWLFLED